MARHRFVLIKSSIMAKLLQIDFPFVGPFGTEPAAQLRELAEQGDSQIVIYFAIRLTWRAPAQL